MCLACETWVRSQIWLKCSNFQKKPFRRNPCPFPKPEFASSAIFLFYLSSFLCSFLGLFLFLFQFLSLRLSSSFLCFFLQFFQKQRKRLRTFPLLYTLSFSSSVFSSPVQLYSIYRAFSSSSLFLQYVGLYSVLIILNHHQSSHTPTSRNQKPNPFSLASFRRCFALLPSLFSEPVIIFDASSLPSDFSLHLLITSTCSSVLVI